MKAGAYDYILKPFDFHAIRMLIEKITGHKAILGKSIFLGKEHRKGYRFENIIGQDPKIFEIFQKIIDVAVTNVTVLITGESGTGKELIADAIHFRSPRRSEPLVRVNCAALTETLINSELFGHEKGAFTGATAQKKGHFELADRGTILLDEIGDIPLPTQISLLRVLESKTFQRVGGSTTLKVDTRVICATNKDLSDTVKEKLFREDLFDRINVVPIHMPPLRERKSDVPLLAKHFLRRYCTISESWQIILKMQ
jgi:two-component system NtrC family response regulator/two-component system response regulator HydG